MTEDVKSPRLPGGSLLTAYLDRQLMIWSDRGGASRYIGDGWAAHCSGWLDQTIDAPWPAPREKPLLVSDILRLDESEAVSREANRNHLENPDFLIIGSSPDDPGIAHVEAVDAKFAADRIKPSQVSAQIVENLITIPEEGVTRGLVEEVLARRGYRNYLISNGSFMCPASVLTDFLLGRVPRNKRNGIESVEIIRLDPAPATMFDDVASNGLVSQLARQDRLPVSPRDNLLSAIYYFRVASACVFLWSEQNTPLFTGSPTAAPEIGLVGADLSQRSTPDMSAYRLMLDMVDDAEIVRNARQSVANVASLPLRISEIRSLLQNVAQDEDKSVLRSVRRDLELEFRKQLFALVGEIPAADPRPLGDILDEVASAARQLRTGMMEYARHLVEKQAVTR